MTQLAPLVIILRTTATVNKTLQPDRPISGYGWGSSLHTGIDRHPCRCRQGEGYPTARHNESVPGAYATPSRHPFGELITCLPEMSTVAYDILLNKVHCSGARLASRSWLTVSIV